MKGDDMSYDRPQHFQSYNHYREWLDAAAEQEISHLLDDNEEIIVEPSEAYGPSGYIPSGLIRDYAHESPSIVGGDWELARLYDDVVEHTDAQFKQTTIRIPGQNPWRHIARAVQETLADDLYCRMFEMLENRGFTIE